MSVHLWVDASAGVAGDMLLAALLDAGADLAVVRAAVAAVLPGEVQITVERVTRAGLAATRVDVAPDDAHGAHPERPWSVLAELLRAADLAEPVRGLALRTFGALARAEAAVHGVDEADVHFHEVGSWDSVADVVGVAAALHDLRVCRATTTPVGLGSGTVRAAHGRLPVPVPAVLRLLADHDLVSGQGLRAAPGEGLVGECATPTGVALLASVAQAHAVAPAGAVLAVGLGAGTRDTPDRANVVRVVLHRPEVGGGAAGEPGEAAGAAGEGAVVAAPAGEGAVHDLVELAATVDDLDPRVWPTVLEACLEAGALDAWLLPVQMKKGRPGMVVHVLARPGDRAGLVDLLTTHTPTLGVRWHAVSRSALARQWREVPVDSGTVRVKLGLRDGQIVTATPELEDCRALSQATGRPLRTVLREAEAAAQTAGWRSGAQP